MSNLQQILELSSSWHKHLCPRQVLGARLALAGAAALGLAIPRRDKRLLLIAETDGCFTSGLEAATGCSPRHRTLRVVDYGKIGVTFVDVKTGTAVRLAPQLDIRQKAYQYAPEEKKRYYAQLIGYQRMPDHELLTLRPVQLTTSISVLVGRAGVRVNCAGCDEEIINEREIVMEGRPLCAACVAPAYYAPQELLFVTLEDAAQTGAVSKTAPILP
jgi:formylmethanofuran dehydrogenase subunit E